MPGDAPAWSWFTDWFNFLGQAAAPRCMWWLVVVKGDDLGLLQTALSIRLPCCDVRKCWQLAHKWHAWRPSSAAWLAELGALEHARGDG